MNILTLEPWSRGGACRGLCAVDEVGGRYVLLASADSDGVPELTEDVRETLSLSVHDDRTDREVLRIHVAGGIEGLRQFVGRYDSRFEADPLGTGVCADALVIGGRAAFILAMMVYGAVDAVESEPRQG